MEVFAEFLAKINNPQHRNRTEDVLTWVTKEFTSLVPKIAWNQPMFTDHGTFIIGFSVSKNHLAVSPEQAGITHFAEEIVRAGYDHGTNLLRIKWDSQVDYLLLEKIIRFNILEKADCLAFWRK